MLPLPPTSTLFPYTTLFRSLLGTPSRRAVSHGDRQAQSDPSLAHDPGSRCGCFPAHRRSEEHTSELQSHHDLVCRLLLEKKTTSHYHSNNNFETLLQTNYIF